MESLNKAVEQVAGKVSKKNRVFEDRNKDFELANQTLFSLVERLEAITQRTVSTVECPDREEPVMPSECHIDKYVYSLYHMNDRLNRMEYLLQVLEEYL